MHLSKIRGAANGKVETSRGRKKPAQEYMGALRECRHKRHIRVKARVPKSIMQEGKKGIRGLISVFMEIRAVTGFVEEILTRKNGGLSGIICRNKVTGEIRVKAESRPMNFGLSHDADTAH